MRDAVTMYLAKIGRKGGKAKSANVDGGRVMVCVPLGMRQRGAFWLYRTNVMPEDISSNGRRSVTPGLKARELALVRRVAEAFPGVEIIVVGGTCWRIVNGEPVAQ